MAIEVPFEDVGSITAAGGVNVLYGSSSSGLQTSSPTDQFWTQNSPGVDDYAENEDAFGITLAAGDFNGDGFDDLAIGVPEEDTSTARGCSPGTNTPGCNAGGVNILYGSSGLQTSSPKDQFWTQDSPSINDSSEAGDKFGTSLV